MSRRDHGQHHRTMLAEGWLDPAEMGNGCGRYTRADSEIVVVRLYPRGWGWHAPTREMAGPYPNRLQAARKALATLETR